jgi:hypothetical protein
MEGFSLPKIDEKFDTWLQNQLDKSPPDAKVKVRLKRVQTD